MYWVVIDNCFYKHELLHCSHSSEITRVPHKTCLEGKAVL